MGEIHDDHPEAEAIACALSDCLDHLDPAYEAEHWRPHRAALLRYRLGLDEAPSQDAARIQLLPCAHCHSADHVEVMYSLTSRTFSISCLHDGWTTNDHAAIADAAREWNAEQFAARERRYSRLTGEPVRLH